MTKLNYKLKINLAYQILQGPFKEANMSFESKLLTKGSSMTKQKPVKEIIIL